MSVKRTLSVILMVTGLVLTGSVLAAIDIDESCVVNIMNRTVQVSSDGTWDMPNVPSFIGRVRARVTCIRNGQTISGATDFFNISNGLRTNVGDFEFNESNSVAPIDLAFLTDEPIYFFDFTPRVLEIVKRDGLYYFDLLSADEKAGLTITSSNSSIVDVESNLLVPKKNGVALVTVRLDGNIITKRVVVEVAGQDADQDGLPDEFEIANGLDPFDPIDAYEDHDKDGLSALEEYLAGTDINVADTDLDGLLDGEELEAGQDGYVTNPLSVDSDGDLLNDRLEGLIGSDPNDAQSGQFSDALESIVVSPSSLNLVFNSIDTEVSDSLSVVGHFIDGSQLDLTSASSGTNYSSGDLSVASFGIEDGRVFGGEPGSTVITVTSNGLSVDVPVTVEEFEPVALAAISIPGYANNVDVANRYAYVASGASGLTVVDVVDPANPHIIGSLDTPGTSIDVKVTGNLVYLADGESGLQIIDVSDPTLPVLVSSHDTGGVAQDLQVVFDRVYIADGKGGLEVVDVSDPSQPFTLGQMSGFGTAKGVDVTGSIAAVVADQGLYLFDVADGNPVQLGSINLGAVKDLSISGDYAHVAVYSGGYRVVDISNPSNLTVVAGQAVIASRDVAIRDGYAFYAEQLFPNVVAYVNVQDPPNSVFQGTIDLSPLGDYAGTGIAVDSQFAYITEESYVVSSDYKATGNTKLFIAQYRRLIDNRGVAPVTELMRPSVDQVLVEGATLSIEVSAEDDVAIDRVEYLVDDQVVGTDAVLPYQFSYRIPVGTEELAVQARAYDLGGNVSETNRRFYFVEPDSDSDGLGDLEEVDIHGTDILKADTDDDELDDGREVQLGTDPLHWDTDGDDLSDGMEVAQGTDPLNPDVVPPTVDEVVPADAALDVRESTAVRVIFDEPIKRRSIKSDSLVLVEDVTLIRVSGSLNLSEDGRGLVFQPDDLLKDYTTYRLTVAGVKDAAGNALDGDFVSTFTTGNYVDTQRPYVASLNPANNATNVPVNSVVTLRFNERVRRETVTAENVYLYDSVLAVTVPAVIDLAEDDRTVTLAPNVPFAVSRQYRVYVRNIRDLFDNVIGSTNYRLTTSFDADALAPFVTGFSLADGQVDVPTNALLQTYFSEPLNPLSLAKVVVLKDGVPQPLQSRSLSADRRVVTLRPADELEANTTYVLRAADVFDVAGNIQATPTSIGFVTGTGRDATRPRLMSYSPAANAENVAVNAPIEAVFNERINGYSIHGANDVRVYDVTNGWTDVSVQRTLSEDGRHLTVMPPGGWVPGRRYYAQISNLRDLAENPQQNNTGWYFYVGHHTDTQAPVAYRQTLEEGAVDVPLNVKLWFPINEALNATCVSGARGVFTASDGSTVNGQLSTPWSSVLAVIPSQTLAANTTYTFSLAGLCDYAGNPMADLSLNFTTGTATDTTRPTVSLVEPTNNATDVNVNSDIILTVNEPVDLSTLGWSVYLYVDNNASRHLGAQVFLDPLDPRRIIVRPTVPMPGNTRIRVYVHDVYDLAGNEAHNRNYYFTTGVGADTEIPQVLSVTPVDGAMDIGRDVRITLQFSEPLNSQTLNDSNFVLYANGETIKPTVSYSGDGRWVNLRASLPASKVVSVVATSGVRDYSGNAIEDFISVFTTQANDDNNRPRVLTQYPGSSARDVQPDAPIVLYFTEDMAMSTFDQGVRISQNGILVSGLYEALDERGRVVRFTPDQPWSYGAYVEVFAGSGLRDVAGNTVTGHQAGFRVIGNPATSSPWIVAAHAPRTTWRRNQVFDIQFSEPMDSLTVTSDNVYLVDRSNNQRVSVDLSLLKGDRLLRVTPTSPLAVDGRYYLDLRSELRDLDGRSFTTNYRRYYIDLTSNAVEDLSSPSVMAISPPDGFERAPVNSRLHVRFDESINPLSLIPENAGQTDYASLNLSNGDREVIYVPHSPYTPVTEISEQLQVQDPAANAAVATTAFTTTNYAEIYKPGLWNRIPWDEMTDVAVNTQLVARANRPLDPLTVNSSTFRVYDYSLGQYVSGAVTLSPDLHTMTFTPNVPWAVGRHFRYHFDGVHELSGQRMDAYHTDFYTSDVTDTTAPEVRELGVPDGLTGVPTNASFWVWFTEPTNPLTHGAGIRLEDSQGNPVPVHYNWLDSSRSLRLRPVNPLLANTGYRLAVTGVKDLAGNTQTTDVVHNFHTANGVDGTRPRLMSYSPAANAENVAVNAPIEAVFNERINGYSIHGANDVRVYDVTNGWTDVSVQRTLSEDGRHLTVMPPGGWVPGRRYYAQISNLRDLAENPQQNNTGWYFSPITQ